MSGYLRSLWLKLQLIWSILLGRPTAYRITCNIVVDESLGLFVECSTTTEGGAGYIVRGGHNQFIGCSVSGTHVGWMMTQVAPTNPN